MARQWGVRGCGAGAHTADSTDDQPPSSSRRSSAALELHALGERGALRRVVFTFACSRCRRAVEPAVAYGRGGAPHLNIPISGSRSSSSNCSARAGDSRDLGGCTEKSAGSAVAVTALPLRPTLRDVTCVVVTPGRSSRAARISAAQGLPRRIERRTRGGASGRRSRGGEDAGSKACANCEEELRRTPALRGYAPMRFTRFVELPASRAARGRGRRSSTAAAARWRRPWAAPSSWAPTSCRCSARRRCAVRNSTRGRGRRSARWCARWWRGSSSIWTARSASTGAAKTSSTPNSMQRHAAFATAQKVAERVAADAKKARVDRVLVVSNARFEALEELLRRLRSGGFAADATRSARSSTATAFGCADGSFFAAFAEKPACARTRWFCRSRSARRSASTLPRCARATAGRRSGWGRSPLASSVASDSRSRISAAEREQGDGGPRTFR